VEGFAYSVLHGQDTSSRITLQINGWETWKAWCELQTSYPYYSTSGSLEAGLVDAGVGGYQCVPPEGEAVYAGSGCFLGVAGQQTPINCSKLSLCEYPVCTCTQTGCTVPLCGTNPPIIQFDMQLASGTLTGSVAGLSINVYNVHLTGS
jgi:hypothetical protein